MYEERILLEGFYLTGLDNQLEALESDLENVQQRNLWTVTSREDFHYLRGKMSPRCNSTVPATRHDSF